MIFSKLSDDGPTVAIIFVLFIFQMVMAVLWKKSFTWEFTPEFILTKEGIIGRRETHVPYRTIQDVMLSQSIFERLLGLCTVKVENATAVAGGSKGRGINRGPRFPGQSLSKGQELVEILKGIRWALKTDGPILCEIMISPDQELIATQGFDNNKDGTFSPRPLEDMYPFLSRKEFLENMVILQINNKLQLKRY